MDTTISLPEQVSTAIKLIDNLIAKSGDNLNIETFRKIYRDMNFMSGTPPALYRIEEKLAEGVNGDILIRLYYPSEKKPLPITIFLHGGWFFMGDLETHDTAMRSFSVESECIVIAVNYRLTPEHPFPTAITDCFSVAKWTFNNAENIGGNSNRIAIAGDSAGGNLATVITRKITLTTQYRFASQVLLYPALDPLMNTPSWKQFKDGPIINKQSGENAWAMYIPTYENKMNPDIAPIYGKSFTDFPTTLIVTAEYDPLRDEAINYIALLKEAKVEVAHLHYKGMVHGFLLMGGIIDDGRQAMKEISNWLKNSFIKM